MRRLYGAWTALAAIVLTTAHAGTPALPAADARTAIKPDVAALLKQSTEVYKRMKSYRHTARWNIAQKGPEGDAHEDLNFTLALERPNRFVYKLESRSQFFPPVAAYCDGTTFVNFKARLRPTPAKEYTKSKAPASYQGINIVDDVEFQPMATYVIALMLQGDALADKDVRAAMEKATLRPEVTENGKKWQVLDMPFGSESAPISLYINAEDHLIGKSTQVTQSPGSETKIVEAIDAVKIDKPIEPAAFQYTLPPDAKQVERFSAPQRPDDAIRRSGPVRIARR